MCDEDQKTPVGTPERFLPRAGDANGEGWRGEAEAVIEDIKPFVKAIDISTKLPCDESGIYINLETKESKKYTVELSAVGFKICALEFDAKVLEGEKHFETPYALLDVISCGYRDSFSGALADKLNALLPGES